MLRRCSTPCCPIERAYATRLCARGDSDGLALTSIDSACFDPFAEFASAGGWGPSIAGERGGVPGGGPCVSSCGFCDCAAICRLKGVSTVLAAARDTALASLSDGTWKRQPTLGQEVGMHFGMQALRWLVLVGLCSRDFWCAFFSRVVETKGILLIQWEAML